MIRRVTSRRLAILLLFTTLGTLPVSPVAPAQAGPSPVPGVRADYDGDGYSDLAIGTGNDDAGAVSGAGTVTVLYGSATGLSVDGAQQWHQDSPGVSDSAEVSDAFGRTLASGDFDGDGYDDLAVASPGEDIQLGPATAADAGMVQLFFGTPGGLIASAESPLVQGESVTPESSEPNDRFGEALAAGDLDDRPGDELVIGAPSEDIGGDDRAGAITILYSSPGTPLGSTKAEVWNQDQARLPDQAEENEAFGWEVEVGNLGRSRHGDLVISALEENVVNGGEGAIHVLYGSDNGVRKKGNRFIDGDSRGVPGPPQYDSNFGQTLEIANFGRGAEGDLAVGSPRKTVDGYMHGGVFVMYGSPKGLRTRRTQLFDQNTKGIRDEVQEVNLIGEGFGQALAGGNLGGSKHADLAIGVPYEWVGDRYLAGATHVLFGSDKGITPKDDLFITQKPAGVPTSAKEDDVFGTTLASANFGRSARRDLAITALDEDAGGIGAAGAVTVLYGKAEGPDTTNGQLWTQATTGVEGEPETIDRFGDALAP
jgi:hypothetical protein